MPTTSDLLFTSASQSDTGNLRENWVDVNNVLAEPDFSYCPLDTGADFSEDMYLDLPLAGVELPSNAVVTHIRLSASCRMVNASSDADIRFGFRTGGFSSTAIQPTTEVEAALRTVADWGLTEQELADFIAGVAGNEAYIRVQNSTTFPATDIRVYWVKCQFTYELLPLANCPALF